MEYIKYGVTILIILLIFWIAENQKNRQSKEIKKMQDNIKVDDNIITYSGLSGKVIKIINDRVIVKLYPSDVELSIEKWAIAGIDDRKE